MISKMPQITLLLTALTTVLLSESAEAQWKANIKHQKQGTYNGIRFIYVDYRGPSHPRYWQDAFRKACKRYSQLDVTYRKGGNYNFFRMRGLSANRAIILGFMDEKTKKKGFLVVRRITSSTVTYSINGQKTKSNGNNPGRFEKWFINTVDNGGNLATGDSGYWHRSAAIQIWKDANELDACASFRIL